MADDGLFPDGFFGEDEEGEGGLFPPGFFGGTYTGEWQTGYTRSVTRSITQSIAHTGMREIL